MKAVKQCEFCGTEMGIFHLQPGFFGTPFCQVYSEELDGFVVLVVGHRRTEFQKKLVASVNARYG